mmetsp:Transcript_58533/g.183526  ORF Transcript_58533/g.183526 Transcript_58533/m.183526 type:complete len:207 (+) Transcript_58533:439-1059(+)
MPAEGPCPGLWQPQNGRGLQQVAGDQPRQAVLREVGREAGLPLLEQEVEDRRGIRLQQGLRHGQGRRDAYALRAVSQRLEGHRQEGQEGEEGQGQGQGGQDVRQEHDHARDRRRGVGPVNRERGARVHRSRGGPRPRAQARQASGRCSGLPRRWQGQRRGCCCRRRAVRIAGGARRRQRHSALLGGSGPGGKRQGRGGRGGGQGGG